MDTGCLTLCIFAGLGLAFYLAERIEAWMRGRREKTSNGQR